MCISGWQGTLIKIVARLIRWNAALKDADSLKKLIRSRRKKSNAIPSHLKKKFHVVETEVDGFKVYTLSPLSGANNEHLLYLHGGAYVFEMITPHWNMLERFIEAFACSISVPIYPLAPEYTYKETHAMITKLYQGLIKKYPKVSLMGDSAGGGLCLALMQTFREEEIPQPQHAILLSPWLDLSMSNPAIADVVHEDAFLLPEGLKAAGEIYAGGTDLKDPKLSPIYGDLKNLAPLTVFMGSHDILVCDARLLQERAKKENVALSYFEYPGMFHVWIAINIPESRDAINKIKNVILANS